MRGRLALLPLFLVLLASCTLPGTTTYKLPAPSISWHACAPFQCGTMTAPLDYAHPNDGRSIDIALLRYPSTNPAQRIGSLLLNPGGPGGSGIQFLKDASLPLNSLRSRFDLVSWDPRGVGQSAPVRCLSGPQLDAFNALDPVLDDPAEKQATITADKQLAAACAASKAVILPYLSTEATAHDLDRIRVALGDSKLTYLGFSYGTFLGLTYAHDFPTHVRALALDGVFNPAESANDLLRDQLAGFQDNLNAFLANCASRRTGTNPCGFAGAGDGSDLAARLNSLLTRLDATPLPAAPGRPLTRAYAYIGVLDGLYSPQAWPALDFALTSAQEGQGAPLLALADEYLGRQADGTYDTSEESSVAINCLDRPVPHDTVSYDNLASEYDAASPFFGVAFQYSNLACAYWPAPAVMTPAPTSAPGVPPLLIVGGTHDPATPYAWAQAVAASLPTSSLLTRQGYGHTSYFVNACAATAINAYLLFLTLPAPDAKPC